jgi:hypothetical protein
VFYTIYKTTHIATGKHYIGKHQTKNINDGYLGSGRYLKAAVAKHGTEAFVKEILHVFDTEVEMNAKEAELVTADFCLQEDTYNLCPGGRGGFGYLNSAEMQTPERRLAKSLRMKERNDSGELNTPEHRLANSLRMKELNTPEQRLHTSQRNSQRIGTFSGKTHSQAAKDKISVARLGKTIGPANGSFGSMWITDGKNNQKIKNVDLMPEGWYKGRSY